MARFSSSDVSLNSEYWNDARYFVDSTDIDIPSPRSVDLGDVILEPRTIESGRIQGLDRFEVGVNISQALFPTDEIPVEGVPVVYIASGYNFLDALVAGPAAARHGGGVLLVEPTAIPAVVAAELTRLRPQRIVVAGEPASVTPAVYNQLHSYVASSSDIIRANGVDRYEASRAVVRDALEQDGTTMAIITTGATSRTRYLPGPPRPPKIPP